MLAQVLVPASLTLGACWFGCFVIAVRAFLTQSLRQIGLLAFAFAGFWAIRHAQYAHCMAVLQAFLTHLLTVDLPKLMVLPKRLEINIPPAVTAVAEAAVGRDVVMRAVASAVLQADALENALIAALPLGPQSAAGGVSLPDSFQGELQVCSCLSVSLFEDALPCSKVTAFPLLHEHQLLSGFDCWCPSKKQSRPCQRHASSPVCHNSLPTCQLQHRWVQSPFSAAHSIDASLEVLPTQPSLCMAIYTAPVHCKTLY